MRAKLLGILPVFIILALAIIVVYHALPDTYFQQDEWMTFTEYLYSLKSGGFVDFPFRVFKSTGHAHLIPLSLLRSYIQISFFKLQFEPYAILSILHHLLNVFLVFYLALLLLKNRILSTTTAVLFGFNSISSQAVTWIAATINTQSSLSCILLSFILFFYYIKSAYKNKFLLFSLLFAFLGTLFKETALVALITLPFFALIWGIERKIFVRRVVPLVLFIVIVYLILRVPFVFLSEGAFEKKPIKPWEEASMTTYVYRAVTYPLKIVSQSIVPYSIISSISNEVLLLGYRPYPFALSGNQANPYIRESITFDLVSYILSLFLIIFGFLSYKSSAIDRQYKKVMLFSFVFVVAGALPYIFLPARPGYFSIFDPRSLYMPSVGSAFLVSIFLYAVLRLIGPRSKKIIYGLVFFIVMIISFYHAVVIRNNIQMLRETAQVRKSILSQTYILFPQLSKKVIFYSESDKEYYGQTEKILPFQSGLGQTLLIWYSFHGENFPRCFFDDNFLYALEDKGKYRECQGRGFGYFRDYDRMLSTIKNEKVNVDNVYAISWDSFQGVISNITPSVRNRLTSSLEKSD